MTSLPLENNNNIFEILPNEFLIEIQQTCSSLTKASLSKDKLFFLKKLKQNLNKLPPTLDISLIHTISNQLCSTLLLLCQNKKYEIEIFEEGLSLYLKLISQMKRKNKFMYNWLPFISVLVVAVLAGWMTVALLVPKSQPIELSDPEGNNTPFDVEDEIEKETDSNTNFGEETNFNTVIKE